MIGWGKKRGRGRGVSKRLGFLFLYLIFLVGASALTGCDFSKSSPSGENQKPWIKLGSLASVNGENVKDYSFGGSCFAGGEDRAVVRYAVGEIRGETNCVVGEDKKEGRFLFGGLNLYSVPEGDFTLEVKLESGEGDDRDVAVEASVLKDVLAPSIPFISLKSPNTSLGSDPTPTLTVSGLVSGETVSLHRANDCTDAPLAMVKAKQESEDISLPPLTEGSHSFYVKALDPALNSSPCSSTPLNYGFDITPPSFTGILVVPAGKTYGVGSSLDFTLNYGESLAVVGRPFLSLTIGSETRKAYYVGGAQNGALVFRYTLVDGDNDSDGIEISDRAVSLGEDNAKISDMAGNRAVLSPYGVPHSLGRVLVDTTKLGVTGLSNGTEAVKTVSWTWSCSRSPCTYRHAINTDRIHDFESSDTFSGTSSASRSSGDGTYYLHVQAKDGQGSLSSVVSVSVALDNTAPEAAALSLKSPSSSPGSDSTPTLTVSGLMRGDTVSLHKEAGCGDAALDTVSVDATREDLIPSSLDDGIYSFYAKTEDAAGNSSCSTAVAYVLDTFAPALSGLADDAEAVKSKSWTWSCSGQESCTFRYWVSKSSTHTFIASDSYSSKVTTSQTGGDGTYYLHVQAKDEAGNTSAVKSVSAVLDNTAPKAPTLALKEPASSPGNDTTPTLSASGLSIGDAISLHKTSGCTDTALATAVAAATSEDFTLCNGIECRKSRVLCQGRRRGRQHLLLIGLELYCGYHRSRRFRPCQRLYRHPEQVLVVELRQ